SDWDHRRESSVMPRWIHHGIVWTENALLAAAPADQPILTELAQRPPVWGPSTVQLILAPSITDQRSIEEKGYFPAGKQPLILGPATPIPHLRTDDFYRYCADTLISRALKTQQGVKVYSLGAPWLEELLGAEKTKLDARRSVAEMRARAEPKV